MLRESLQRRNYGKIISKLTFGSKRNDYRNQSLDRSFLCTSFNVPNVITMSNVSTLVTILECRRWMEQVHNLEIRILSIPQTSGW